MSSVKGGIFEAVSNQHSPEPIESRKGEAILATECILNLDSVGSMILVAVCAHPTALRPPAAVAVVALGQATAGPPSIWKLKHAMHGTSYSEARNYSFTRSTLSERPFLPRNWACPLAAAWASQWDSEPVSGMLLVPVELLQDSVSLLHRLESATTCLGVRA